MPEVEVGQLPVCCQCTAPPPAPASTGQRSHWQTGQEPGRESEKGEPEQQAERWRDIRDREEEQVRERLVLRERKIRELKIQVTGNRKVETEKCQRRQEEHLQPYCGYLSVLFGRRLNGKRGVFLFSRYRWKGPACAFVADVAADVSVPPPRSRRL